MNKFKEGDNVVLKEGLKLGENYNGLIVEEKHLKCKSKVMKVSSSFGDKTLFIKNNSALFGEDMLEKYCLKDILKSKGIKANSNVVIKNINRIGVVYRVNDGCVFIRDEEGKTYRFDDDKNIELLV